jgi:hypothetical protein
MRNYNYFIENKDMDETINMFYPNNKRKDDKKHIQLPQQKAATSLSNNISKFKNNKVLSKKTTTQQIDKNKEQIKKLSRQNNMLNNRTKQISNAKYIKPRTPNISPEQQGQGKLFDSYYYTKNNFNNIDKLNMYNHKRNKQAIETLVEFMYNKKLESNINYNEGYAKALNNILEMIDETDSLEYIHESIGGYFELDNRRNPELHKSYNEGYDEALIDVFNIIEETESIDCVYESINEYFELDESYYSNKNIADKNLKGERDKANQKKWNKRIFADDIEKNTKDTHNRCFKGLGVKLDMGQLKKKNNSVGAWLVNNNYKPSDRNK